MAALAALLLADGALFYVIWRAGGAGPKAMREQRQQLRLQDQLLGADVRRAASIRSKLPDVQRETAKFFEEQFLSAQSGYSTIVADLNSISAKSNLRATSITFKQREFEKRDVVEVAVTAVVEGDYASLVRFINGIERSQNFYLLDSLSLASSAGGTIKLNLLLRTYFRTAPGSSG
jgi:Tfp pilus assembly protein PilO